VTMIDHQPVRSVVDIMRLPAQFPTHRHEGTFWERLGRAVATFGFLEETLAKAIFAFTATRRYDDAEVQHAFDAWLPQLERALTDPLGNLINVYGKAVRDHPEATITNLDDLLRDLRRSSEMRNILCHGSWRPPDATGRSLPFFVNRQKHVVDTAMDNEFLAEVQRHAAELACEVMNTVTHMGWRFPGTSGPGKSIWPD
jgi:hypothetical protein